MRFETVTLLESLEGRLLLSSGAVARASPEAIALPAQVRPVVRPVVKPRPVSVRAGRFRNVMFPSTMFLLYVSDWNTFSPFGSPNVTTH